MTVVREVLRNNYLSHNLIGCYHFLVISPRNSTLFTGPFLTGRHARAGLKTSYQTPSLSCGMGCGHVRLVCVYTSLAKQNCCFSKLTTVVVLIAKSLHYTQHHSIFSGALRAGSMAFKAIYNMAKFKSTS